MLSGWLLVNVETVCRRSPRLTANDMAGTGHTGSSRLQLASSGVASAPFELHEVADHSSAARGFRFMGWDCHSGDVSAGVLCRALRRAARAPPSTRRVPVLPNLRATRRHSPPGRRQPPGSPVPRLLMMSEAAASFQLAGDLLSPTVRVRLSKWRTCWKTIIAR